MYKVSAQATSEESLGRRGLQDAVPDRVSVPVLLSKFAEIVPIPRYASWSKFET